MRSLFIIVFLLSACILYAQDKPKMKFQSEAQIGFVEGGAGSAFQLQTVNGFRYKTFALGIGVGLDYYVVRSIPLFLDFKKDILNRSQTPFFYVSGGRHFPWEVQKDDWQKSFPESGWFYDAGLGYTIPLKKHSIIFTAGYSFKSFDEVVEYPIMCLWGDCPPVKESFSYKLRRLSLRAGFRF